MLYKFDFLINLVLFLFIWTYKRAFLEHLVNLIHVSRTRAVYRRVNALRSKQVRCQPSCQAATVITTYQRMFAHVLVRTRLMLALIANQLIIINILFTERKKDKSIFHSWILLFLLFSLKMLLNYYLVVVEFFLILYLFRYFNHFLKIYT